MKISEGKAVEINGKKYVCTERITTFGDSDDYVTIVFRKIDDE